MQNHAAARLDKNTFEIQNQNRSSFLVGIGLPAAAAG
jgi:hypothetical protein